MAVTATLVHDPGKGWVPRWRRSGAGWSGRDPYKVNTSEVDEALGAAGLPSIGSPHPTRPGCLVDDLEYEYEAGGDGTPEKGTGVVWVSYALAQASPFQLDALAEVGFSYTEINVSGREVTARTDRTGAAVAETTIEAPSAELVLIGYYDSIAPMVSFLGLLSPLPRINANTLTLPPPYGVGGSLTVQPRQLLPRGVRVQNAAEGKLRIEFVFGYGAAGWMDHVWRRTAADGTPTGATVTSQMYDQVNYSVFW